MRAAKTSFSQVLPMLMMWIPSESQRNTSEPYCADRRQISLTVGPPLPDVGKHLLVAVLAANVRLGGEEKLDFLIGGTEDGGEF